MMKDRFYSIITPLNFVLINQTRCLLKMTYSLEQKCHLLQVQHENINSFLM